MPETRDALARAERAFEDLVSRHGAPDHAHVEHVCGAQPELATALREIYGHWRRAKELLSAAEPPPLAERLASMFGAPAAATPSDGATTSDRYQTLGEIGRGGMGEVHRVFDADLQRELALKVVHRRFAGDARAAARFLEEAQVTAQLDHPGIVPVHDLGLGSDGRLYYTMKLVRGQTFGEVIEEVHGRAEDWSLPRAVTVLVRICEAMEYAHRKGVVHRDLKPNNVMVGRFGEVYVMDWGLAKVLGGSGDAGNELTRDLRSPRRALGESTPDSPLLTHDGDVVGTPAYMAPEQASGDVDRIAPSVDVFAVGAMLQHLLAGAPPPAAASAAAPAELVAVCERATAPTVGERYPSIHALREDLGAWLEGRVVHAYERGAVARLRKRVRRNKLVAGLAALLLVAAPVIASLGGFALAKEAQARNEAERARLLRYREDLAAAIRAAEGLRPAWPAQIAALRQWLSERGEPLARAITDVDSARQRSLASTDSEVDRFLMATLDRLLVDLRGFAHPQLGLLADVRRRLAWATMTTATSITAHRAAWDDVCRALAVADGIVASALYGAVPIDLAPQLDLVPIGMNPATKLWEFYHLPSAGGARTLPRHDADGHIAVTADTGIVFVLVPGGTFWMGASPTPGEPNFDPAALLRERPPRRLALAPYFIARHELTVSQWQRLSGRVGRSESDPSNAPVSLVSWHDCDTVLRAHALSLPTEAQWEYAARAGTDTPWWTGDTPASLRGAANLADASLARRGLWSPGLDRTTDDGFDVPGDVGALRANTFGLHHVHGNVFEWTRDAYGTYETRSREGDGLCYDTGFYSTARGGCYDFPPEGARSSHRLPLSRDYVGIEVGVRAARSVFGAQGVPLPAPVPGPVRWDANGHIYQFVPARVTWDEARRLAGQMLCQGVAGHLATITSAAENEFVAASFTVASAWLGGTKLPDGNWSWITGEPWTYSRWGPNEPSNQYKGDAGDAPIGIPEDALAFWVPQPSFWNDLPRHPGIRGPFLVEWDLR